MLEAKEVDGSLYITSGEYTAIISTVMISRLKVAVIRKCGDCNELIDPLRIFSNCGPTQNLDEVAFQYAVNRLLELNQ